MQTKKEKLQKNNFTLILIAASVALIAYGGYGLWQRYLATHEGAPAVSTSVIKTTADKPKETKPNCRDFKAEKSYPERINLPSINASGCIEQVDVDQKGEMATPANIHTAAWFVKSKLPGQEGLSIINGHVRGWYSEGIFERLDRLKEGDEFSVKLGGGKKLTYQVFKNQTVSVDEAGQKMLDKSSDVKSQLNLITCGGQFDQSKQLYEKRIIVSAKLL